MKKFIAAFAACALIPFPALASIVTGDVAADHDYPARLLRDRRAVWERCRF